ncbi:MAG TPA: hypothetical protein VF345_07985 [Chthoniobacterales bacterium]
MPTWLQSFVPHLSDPTPLVNMRLDPEEFSRRVSSVCVNRVWRSTRANRHLASAELLRSYLSGRSQLRVLDVGVSDGVTTLDLAEVLSDKFSILYVTDMYLALRVAQRNGMTYFYDENEFRCVFVASDWLIYYSTDNRRWNPLAWIARTVCERAPQIESGNSQSLSLLNPKLRQLAATDVRLQLAVWDVFTPWPREPVDIVRAANILNPAYFEAEALGVALSQIGAALRSGGLFLVVDNRNEEASTLFEKHGNRFVPAARLGAGCEIEALAQRVVLS